MTKSKDPVTVEIRLRHAASILKLVADGRTPDEARRILAIRSDYYRRIVETATGALDDPLWRLPSGKKGTRPSKATGGKP